MNESNKALLTKRFQSALTTRGRILIKKGIIAGLRTSVFLGLMSEDRAMERLGELAHELKGLKAKFKREQACQRLRTP